MIPSVVLFEWYGEPLQSCDSWYELHMGKKNLSLLCPPNPDIGSAPLIHVACISLILSRQNYTENE